MNTPAWNTREDGGFFGPPGRALFGWLHAGGPGELSGTGIVFCQPLGYEAVSAHLALRAASSAAARRGAATLRFDYDGCGDSTGDDLDAARVAAWLDSVDQAIDALKRAAPLRRLCLWGLRAGSLLAAQIAQRRGDIQLLVLSAPPRDGSRFLREQRALAAAGNTPAPAAGVQEVAGFLFTADTSTALAALSLSAAQPPGDTAVLVQHRDDLPFDDAWPEAWRGTGTSIAVQPFAGHEAMLRDPHRAQVPQAMIDAALEWIAAARPTERTTTAAAAQGGVLRATAEVVPGKARESVLWLGREPATFAILCEPLAASDAPRPMLVLLNAGSVHHIGPNRLHVQLARQLASDGISVARIDLPGLGDAAGHADARANHPYQRHALDDLRAALQALRTRCQPTSLHAAGICSGAYHALHLAAAAPLLDSAIIINPLTFHWREGMEVAIPGSKVVAESARYQQRLWEPSAWLKLLRGQVALGRLLRIIGRRLLQVSWRQLRAATAAVGLPIRSRLERTLAAASAHGARLSFVIADSEPGLAMLQEQAGPVVAQLQQGGRLQISVIADADHTFTHFRPRQQLLARIGALLRESVAYRGIESHRGRQECEPGQPAPHAVGRQ